MKNIIEDIKSKLSNNLYKNEEHVRLSLVARIVQTLGWNIWNPIEVNCEFNSVPNEDKTRVDMALFITQYSAPAVFMEIKAVGKTDGPALIEAEKQVRDYNRNNTATFSVITDGRKWRFYLSQTGGEFSHKCFRQVDLLTDASEDIEMVFNKFLSRLTISSDSARREAEHILNSSKKERAMIDALSKARSEILLPENSLISLVQLFIQKTHESGFNITEIEASVFIKKPCLKPMIVSNEPQIIPSITFGKAVLTSTTNRRRNRVFPKGCEVDGIHYNSANQAVKSLIRGGKLQQSDIPQLSYNAHKWLNENSNKFHFNYRRDV